MKHKTEGTELTEATIKAMREVDIRTVNPDTLVDIKNVKIDTSLPQKERMLDYIRQIKNPYCYLDHGTIVKLSFLGNRSLEEALLHYISHYHS